MSRLQQIEAKGAQPCLPPEGAAAYLTGYLFDAGPVGYGAMGPVPLSHSEIAAWQQNTGIELAAWEARAIRTLSSDYLVASNAADAHDCPPYYIERLSDRPQDDGAIDKLIAAIFADRIAMGAKP